MSLGQRAAPLPRSFHLPWLREALAAVGLAALLATPMAVAALAGPGWSVWAAMAGGWAAYLAIAWRADAAVAVGALLVWLATQRMAAALLSPFVPAEEVRHVLAYKEGLMAALLLTGAGRLLWRWRQGSPLWRPLLPDLLALLFLMVVLAHFVLSEAALADRLTYLRRWCMPCLLYFAGRALTADPSPFLRSLRLFLGLAALVAVFGLVERFLLAPAFWMDTVDAVAFYRQQIEAGLIPGQWLFVYRGLPDGVFSALPLTVPVRRLVSTFLEPTTLALFLALALVLALAAQPERRRPIGWPLLALALLLATALVATLGRAGMLVAVVGAGALALLALGRGRPWPALAAATVLPPLLAALAVTTLPDVPARGQVTALLEWSSAMPAPASPPPAGAPAPSGPAPTDRPPGSTAEGAARHVWGLREGLQQMAEAPLGLGLGAAGLWSEAPHVGGESALGALTAQLGVFGLGFWLLFLLSLAAGLLLPSLGDAKEERGLHWRMWRGLAAGLLGLLIASWFSESAAGVTGTAAYYLFAGWGVALAGGLPLPLPMPYHPSRQATQGLAR